MIVSERVPFGIPPQHRSNSGTATILTTYSPTDNRVIGGGSRGAARELAASLQALAIAGEVLR